MTLINRSFLYEYISANGNGNQPVPNFSHMLILLLLLLALTLNVLVFTLHFIAAVQHIHLYNVSNAAVLTQDEKPTVAVHQQDRRERDLFFFFFPPPSVNDSAKYGCNSSRSLSLRLY